MEQRIIPIRYGLVAIILKYTPPSDALALLQATSDIQSDTKEQLDNNDRRPKFPIENCIAIKSDTEKSIPAMTSSVRLFHMVVHPN